MLPVSPNGSPPAHPHSPETGRFRSDALTRVARLLKILLLVRSRPSGTPLGRQELAEACDCDVRTIQRDLSLLQEQGGLCLDYDRAERAYRLADPGWSFSSVDLTLEETMALALVRGLLVAPGVPSHETAERALDKVTGGLSTRLRSLLTEAAAVVRTRPLPRDYSDAPVSPLLEAALKRQTVEIDYESRNRKARTWRRVDPYAVEPRDGVYWELHGWCWKNRSIRTFALDRIHEVRLLSEPFTVRAQEWEAFRSEKGIVGGIRGGERIEVEVRFSPEVAAFSAGRYWAESLSVEWQADGSALLKGTALGVEGLVPELLRWRRYAEVIGGAELRKRMEEEVKALAALYGTGISRKVSDAESE